MIAPLARRTLATSLTAIVLSVVPTFLLGSVAVLIREDMAFSEAHLGLCIAAFYASTAVAAVHGGRLAERLGGLRASTLGVAASAAALLGVAALARVWWHIVVLLALAGAVNALTQAATNLALTRAVPSDHQGFAFGLKQADGSLAALVAGVVAATVASAVGWRWAFAAVAVSAALAFRALRPARAPHDPPRPRAGDEEPVAALPAMLLVALGGGFAWAAGAATGGFYVESAVAGGRSLSAAGWWLVAGSAFGTLARASWGTVVDRGGVGAFRLVALLLGCGSAGLALLSVDAGAVGLAVGTAVVFGTGWAYPGILVFGVVRSNPTAPARASGIVLSGTACGGVVGPPLFGMAAQHFGYPTAWRSAGVALVLAALVMLGGDRLLRQRKTSDSI